jgi:hypothetical protein
MVTAVHARFQARAISRFSCYLLAMKTGLSFVGLLLLVIPAFSANDPRAHKVTTPPLGRTAYPEKQFSISAVEAGVTKQEKEEKRKKEAEAKGDVYLGSFELPIFPARKDLAEMKSLLKAGDQIWWFHGLDHGWIILRGDKEIYQLVTGHDY